MPPENSSDIPQDVWTDYLAKFGARTSPKCGLCGYWHSFPPNSFYAAWKYAQVFGNAKPIFDQMGGKLETPLSDSYYVEKPYMLNLYISGYQGYLELQKLAGYSKSSVVRNYYNHLLSLRTSNFINVLRTPQAQINMLPLQIIITP